MKQIKDMGGVILLSVFVLTTLGLTVTHDRLLIDNVATLSRAVKLLANVTVLEEENTISVPPQKDSILFDLIQQVNNLNTQLISSSEEEAIKINDERIYILEKIARISPQSVLGLRIPSKENEKLSSKVSETLEKDVWISGEVSVLIQDDFENKTSTTSYVLHTGDQSIPLYVAGDLNILSGTEVSIEGLSFNNKYIVADARRIKFPPISVTLPETVGDQKTLVILGDFMTTPLPFDKSGAEELVFNSTFQDFMKEQSYNRISFSGMATNWIQIRNAQNPYFACGTISLNSPEVKNYILSHKIDLNEYSRIIYMIGGGDAVGGCSIIGKHSVTFEGNIYTLSELWVGVKNYDAPSPQDLPQTYVKLREIDYLLAHEMGHSLGLDHANYITCEASTFEGNCFHRTYGNVFDVMGFAYDSLHYNAFFKEKLGWLDPNSLLAINHPGRYEINSLEDGKIKAAKIQMPGSKAYPYYIEFRNPTGYDAELSNPSFSGNQKGLMVNYVGEGKGQIVPQLLDFSPSEILSQFIDFNNEYTLNPYSRTFPTKPLSALKGTFFDFGTGISFGAVQYNGVDTMSFDVNLGAQSCLRRKPAIGNWYLSNKTPVTAGSTIYLASVDFTNRDSLVCGDSVYNLTSSNVNVTTAFLSPSNATTAEVDQVAFNTLMLDIAPYVNGGEYIFPIYLQNMTTGSQYYIGDAVIEVQ